MFFGRIGLFEDLRDEHAGLVHDILPGLADRLHLACGEQKTEGQKGLEYLQRERVAPKVLKVGLELRVEVFERLCADELSALGVLASAPLAGPGA